MQLILVALALAFLLFTQELKAQIQQVIPSGSQSNSAGDSVKTEVAEYENPNWRDVDVDFLSSYYQQDGNNAAVTGGTGTEFLTDFTQKVIIKLPVNRKLTLNLDGGYDYYTSASSDNVDPIKSDDSGEDMRIHGNVGISYQLDPQQTIGVRAGGSGEYDYGSFQAGLNYARISKGENTVFAAQFQAFVDEWSLIYPVELRNEGELLTRSDRQSFNLALSLTQVLDRKTQMSLQLEGVAMNGLLSTPFHRAYFQEQAAPRVEMLPSTRIKIPVGIRLNRYINEHLLARLYYRYYFDTWGVKAHTASIELPIKLTRFLALKPFYRFHTQTAADYFKPYKQHSVQDQFYTSDHDLAALTSHSFGLGLSYQPAGGIFDAKLPGKKGRGLKLKNIDLKYSHYSRSTGLQADIVSFGMGFTIHR